MINWNRFQTLDAVRSPRWPRLAMLVVLLLLAGSCAVDEGADRPSVAHILVRVAAHDFHPLAGGDSLTLDRSLKQHGIADLEDNDWKVRLLAVRDLVRAGSGAVSEIANGLGAENADVRQVCAMALGILRAKQAVGELERTAQNDGNTIVRSQAVIALGQIESLGSLEFLRERLKDDLSRDVRYQCALAIDQIEKRMGTTQAQLKAFQDLDESSFQTLRVRNPAPDFALEDTDGKVWHLSDFRAKKWVVLIWVFADWCPVCHGEFRELMASREEFEENQVQVFTIECHDRYRGRVMVGKELEPEHWFAKQSFKEAYGKQIWWPHLLDRAGAVGAMYGVDPMAFAVHAEYINRPSTVIVDKEGIVQLAYYGTFWGDRPTIAQTLNMIKTGRFDFEHPKRLHPRTAE